MDPIIDLLLKSGPAGVFAVVGFYLYLRERKITHQNAQTTMQHLVEETAAKVNLTKALENIAHAVTLNEQRIQTDLDYLHQYVTQRKLDDAREEGRREVTGRFRIPTGDDNGRV